MEPGTEVLSGRHSTAPWLRRAGDAIKKFFGPLEPAGAPGATRERASVPPCVWYGRAVFCLYLPEPFPQPVRPGREVNVAPGALDPRIGGRHG
jgi:hypothetical protein